MSDGTELVGNALTYARRVGQRLRAIRRQKRLSLQEVEAASSQEFKASVLGAYERGERSSPCPDCSAWPTSTGCRSTSSCPATPSSPTEVPASGVEPTEVRAAVPVWPSKVTFDLARFQAVDGDPELEMVYKYLSSIQVRRQDFNGRVLTIRADDIPPIAGLFGTDADALLRRLDDLQLRLQPA